jgi:SAM-dependent methyltransferase
VNQYDAVEYPSRSFRQTHADRLATMAALFGLTPPPPATCRFLEVGCGAGGNLIPMAYALPEAQFFGFDLAAKPIEHANAVAAELGLRNVNFRQLDMMEFPAGAGQFDYIVAHGFYSWVPDFVREKFFQVCEDHLAPGGVVFVSYNAYPGCHVRRMWREMMQFHTRAMTDTNQRIDQAIGLIQLVAHGTNRTSPLYDVARRDHEDMVSHDRHVVYHDELADVWEPFYFHQVAAHAARHGLEYLAESTYTEMQPVGLTEAAAGILASLLQQDLLLYEQYLDFLKLRRFRQTLFVRHGQPIERTRLMERMPQFLFASAAEPGVPDDPNAPLGTVAFRNQLNNSSASTNDPLALHAMQKLYQAWPRTVAFADLLPEGADAQQLAGYLVSLFSSGVVELHVTPRRCANRVGERPEVWPGARRQAQYENIISTLVHGTVKLEEESVRQLVIQLDGTRTRDDVRGLFATPEELDFHLNKLARSGLLVDSAATE